MKHILAPILLLVFLSPSLASEFELQLDSETITINLPSDLCAVEPGKSTYEEKNLTLQQKVNEGKNTVVGIFENCSQLKQIRSGVKPNASRKAKWVILLAQHRGLTKPTKWSTMTRSEHITDMSEFFAEEGFPNVEEEVKSKFNENLPTLWEEDIKMTDLEMGQMHSLLTDEFAFYYLMRGQVAFNDKSREVLAIMATTLVKSYAVSLNFYIRNYDDGDIGLLIKEARKTVEEMVIRNN